MHDADKPAFDTRLSSGASPETKYPSMFAAGLMAGLGVRGCRFEPGAFSKLVIHELAHHLHESIVGGGGDPVAPDAVFREVCDVAAKHIAGDVGAGVGVGDHDDAVALIGPAKRGRYEITAFRMLLRKRAMSERVAHARRNDFNGWAEGALR